ncbi:DMT family transporter [Asticcacaulis sp. BYS171W]|uniref:DMT family transporter n=1 Tax=Asticcacaulis aquaticus TaxID=2984212 RepID=A0ABT5HTI9_9CAUL|nr:DMT family transporter [Asticcacaulis aquaticus]MDC7683386.1 DMT family transporter [Asticcacaulis aquaticus]
MSAASLLRLLSLAAIWGGSFLFMRLSVPALGPVWLITLRVLLAGLFLTGVGLVLRKALQVKGFYKYFLILGLFNSAVPFLLFAFAAQTLSASLLSILNSMAPLFGVLISSLWTRSLPTVKTMIGMVLGLGGVAVLVGLDAAHLTVQSLIAIGAGMMAALCYAIASVYARQAKRTPDPLSNAHGGMWASVLLIAPFTPFFAPQAAQLATVTPLMVAAVLALGIVCSGIAYMIYFKLVADIGAAQALTVTFLVPVFGTLWGYLFLHEGVGWSTLIGGALILYGTALVVNFSPRALLKRQATLE